MLRAVCRDDIPQLARLHLRVGEDDGHSYAEVLRAYESLFPRMFLAPARSQMALSALRDENVEDVPDSTAGIQDHRWSGDVAPCLVFEGDDGQVFGLLASVTRPMSFRGTPVTMAVSSRLTVDPAARSTLAGIRLVQSFLDGPQDFSIADQANEPSRRLWEAFGGRSVPIYSLRWHRLLSPCRYAVSKARSHKALSVLSRLAAPFASLADRFAARGPAASFRIGRPKVDMEPLTPDVFQQRLPRFISHQPLVPVYGPQPARWVWERLGHMWDGGRVYAIAVRSGGTLLGWYIYNAGPDGVARVAQVVAEDETVSDVLTHLFWHAKSQGAVAVTGRVHPPFLHAYGEQHCTLSCHDEYALIHSRNDEIVRTFERGDAFVTDMEGEGCLYLSITADTTPARSTPDTPLPAQPDAAEPDLVTTP